MITLTLKHSINGRTGEVVLTLEDLDIPKQYPYKIIDFDTGKIIASSMIDKEEPVNYTEEGKIGKVLPFPAVNITV